MRLTAAEMIEVDASNREVARGPDSADVGEPVAADAGCGRPGGAGIDGPGGTR